MTRIALLAAAALCLAACSTDPLAHKFVSMKVQAAGFNFSPTTGFTGGYAATTGHFSPATTPDGRSLLTVQQPCGQSDVIATLSNLNSKATASANSTGVGQAPGVNAPTVSWASGDQAATGAAARILALGGGVAPTPEALAAYQHSCPPDNGASLPFAPAGSVVDHGVAPK